MSAEGPGRGSAEEPDGEPQAGSLNGRARAGRVPRVRRVRVGELLALAGAVCVIVSLFLPWYESAAGKLSAWATFGPAVALLIAATAASLALFVSALTERSPALPVSIGVWSTLLAIAASSPPSCACSSARRTPRGCARARGSRWPAPR